MPGVLHPEFEGAARYTLLPMWSNAIKACARGSFPKGVTYNARKRVLRVTTKGAQGPQEYTLPDTPTEAYKVIITALKTAGLGSSPSPRREKVPEACRLKDIKSSNIRFALVRQYAREVAPSDVRRVHALIDMGIYMKIIRPEHITVSKGRIESIPQLVKGSEGFALEGQPLSSASRSSRKKPSRPRVRCSSPLRGE